MARLALVGLVLVWCLASARGAPAAPANFAGASVDGAVVFFTTTDKLVPGDTDGKLDVYERSYDSGLESHVTREVSTGPTGGNDAFDAFHAGATADGNRVFFTTSESLVAADGDHAEDIYMRDFAAGLTTLISVGAPDCAPSCGNGVDAAIYFDVSSDGSRVDFISAEHLVAADGDAAADVYQRDLDEETTTLVSRGAAGCAPGCGNGTPDSIFQGASADGTRIVFASSERLAGGDTDSLGDLYERDLTTATTTLVSTPGTCPPMTDCTPAFGAIVGDGSLVFFETNERLTGADTDSSSDLYESSGGTNVLLSTGPAGGNGSANATYETNAAGGAAVFFETSEKLVAADTDSAIDVYERSGAVTSLVSIGPGSGNGDFPATLDKVSADGGTVLFSSAEALLAEDGDSALDVYSRTGGALSLVSLGPGGGNGGFGAGFAGASGDATHVLFETAEQLLAEDHDSRPDVYERAGAVTSLVSKGPIGHDGPFDPNLSDVSADGARALFITEERLTEGDLDTERDVYDFSSAGTLLVSVGNSLQLGPPTPTLTSVSPPSPNASTTPAILGQAEAGTAIKIYTSSDCSGATAGTGTALQLATTGITTTVEAGATTTFKATATDANGDTSACSSSAITYRQQDVVPPEEGGGDQGDGTGGGGSGAVPPGVPAGAPQKPGGGNKGGGGDRSSAGAMAPRTKLTFAPLFRTRVRRPVIGFVDATGQEGTVFSCRVDRRPWARCSSPHRIRKLAPGRHVFRVKGVNGGLWESPAVVRRFKVVSR